VVMLAAKFDTDVDAIEALVCDVGTAD